MTSLLYLLLRDAAPGSVQAEPMRAIPTPRAITAQVALFRREPLHLTASWALFPSVAVDTHVSQVWAFLASNRQYAAPLASAPFRLAQQAVVIDPVPAAPKH